VATIGVAVMSMLTMAVIEVTMLVILAMTASGLAALSTLTITEVMANTIATLVIKASHINSNIAFEFRILPHTLADTSSYLTSGQ